MYDGGIGIKTGAVFLFSRREISGLFSCPKKISKFFCIRNILRFSHCSLCEGEREILFKKGDGGDDRDGLSEIYRDRHRKKIEIRYIITAPTFTILNTAPTCGSERKELVCMIQQSSEKRGRLSVKNEAQKRTAIRGYLIRKDNEHRFCMATKPEAPKALRGAAPMTP